MPGRPHSEHNEKLCDLLLKDGNFDDWVVTTAFYAAIHLVDYQIFPFKDGAEPEFGSFKQYLNRKSPQRAPHEVRRDLVASHLNKCSGAFSWLMDTCHNTRYNQYDVPKEFATRARGCLDSIKNACPKK
jgi:hypothetical protein